MQHSRTSLLWGSAVACGRYLPLRFIRAGGVRYTLPMRLSVFILENMEPILLDWVEFASSLGDVTSEMDDVSLRDHAELILRAVATDLETSQSDAQQEAKSSGDAPARPKHLPVSAATSHGVVRAEEGFSLEQMVSEYRALRASVLRLWAKVQTAPDPESFQELMRFNEAIDEALADSIKTYSGTVDQLAVSKARYRMQALGTLSAGLGHDMANVLMPMRMCLSTLADKRLPPESAPLVDALRRAVGHLGGLTKGLRALAMDSDSSAASHDRTVLHEWWASAISPFTWALPMGVRLHAEGLSSEGKALPPVRIPAHVLMQAVFNLVQNAAQALGHRNANNKAPTHDPPDTRVPLPSHDPHAPPNPQASHDPHTIATGNIWITAELVPASRDDGKEAAVRLTVRDDGPGMAPSTVARCTEAFFTTKAKNHGTGLGLYLVCSAVERHCGQVIVESEVDVGTTVTLLLPVAEQDEEA
jgi:signal transduction histidine kinase